MVDPAGGTLTRTCSPHLERATVSLLPPEAVAVSWTGSGAPIAETVSVLVNAGAELVAAVSHFRLYSFLAAGAGRTASCPRPPGGRSPLKKPSAKQPGPCTGSCRL